MLYGIQYFLIISSYLVYNNCFASPLGIAFLWFVMIACDRKQLRFCKIASLFSDVIRDFQSVVFAFHDVYIHLSINCQFWRENCAISGAVKHVIIYVFRSNSSDERHILSKSVDLARKKRYVKRMLLGNSTFSCGMSYMSSMSVSGAKKLCQVYINS